MPPRTLRVAELLNRIENRTDPNMESGLRQAALDLMNNERTQLGSGTSRLPGMAPTQTPTGVYNPVPGAQLSNSFGAPRSGGRRHQGIDIMAQIGTPIIAPVDGVAERGGYWNDVGGHSVGLRDATGNWHYFTHMNEPSPIKQGDFIRAGQVLGFVGMSGNAAGTTPHVHYSINEGRQNVINAYDFLTGGR